MFPIASGRPVMTTYRQVHLPSGVLQLVRYLSARGSGPDDQNSAFRQLEGILVFAGMYLDYARLFRNQLGDNRTLKRSGGGDNILGLEFPLRSVDLESYALMEFPDRFHLHTAPDWRIEIIRICRNIVCHFLFWSKIVLMNVRDFHAGKAIVPSRSIGE